MVTKMKSSISLSIAWVTITALSQTRYLIVSGNGVFSYDRGKRNGPENWKMLDLEGNECGGTHQSGVDIPAASSDDGCHSSSSADSSYVFTKGDCTLADLDFVVNDHSVQVDYPMQGCKPPSMTIPGIVAKWKATNFHFHSGSEHALNGIKYEAELHVVHQEVGGDNMAVLSLFLDVLESSSDTKPLLDDLLLKWEEKADLALLTCSNSGDRPLESGDSGLSSLVGPTKSTFHPYMLLPDSYSIYNYQGSLTTPPCSEGVAWNVVDTPVVVSVEEFDRLQSLILEFVDSETCEHATAASPSGRTSRPLNPLNGRLIVRYCCSKNSSEVHQSHDFQWHRRKPPTADRSTRLLRS